MTRTDCLQFKPAQRVGAIPWREASTRNIIFILLLVIGLTAAAGAQTPIPASSQFDITGFIQVATLGGPGTGAGAGAHQGGNITVNGQVITVPSETIVMLPANALTWQELFAQAPGPYGPTQTGMALADLPAPLTTYEAQVIGNRVGDTYIAGLIYISQHALNTGAGFINCMNYALGEMRVGGPIGNCAAGTRVRINDPLNPVVGTGRYGRPQSPDIRFTVDQDNPTIAAATGFPMCFPRVLADPAIPGNPDDPLCPQTQRPAAVPPATGFAASVQMNDPALPGNPPPDARIQAPFEVGDFVTFAGTLVADSGFTAGPTAGPWPGIANTYISAHTISNNIAIYTWPNTNPAYVSTEVTIVGTGGLTVIGAGEAAIRTKFEGMTTDVNPNPALQRKIHLYGIDVNPADGSTSDRDWGTIGVDPGPPLGAVKGRWRFRPPCLPFGSNPAKPDKDCVMNASGTFLPPTREMRAVIEGAWTPAGPQNTYANGIIAGQYHAPIGEYIFPENIPGAPIVENNFNTIPFLAQGGYTSSAGTLVGQLDPWPSNIVPLPACTPPGANAGGSYAVGSGGTVALNGNATGTGPFTWSWNASGGTLSDPSVQAPNFTAPAVAVDTVINLSLTATNACGAATATSTVAVSAGLAPTVNPIANQTVISGDAGTFSVSGSDPNVPASLPLSWSISQTGTPALLSLTIASTGPSTASVNYTAPSGVATPTDITVAVVATNASGVVSAPVSATITINPAVACTAPVANAGGPYTVASGSSFALGGSATGTAPITFAWATPAQGTITPLNNPTATYTAPVVIVATSVPLSLTATNSCGSNTATSSVTINAALPPVINSVAPITVLSGAPGTAVVSGSDPNNPALLPLSWTVTQNGAPALIGLAITPVSPNPPGTNATLTFVAPTLPLGQVVPSVIQLSITARNTAGLNSAPAGTSVTVNPLPDIVGVTAAEYRTGKRRLSITATSSVVSPNVVLKLQPYLTTTGTVYNPDPAVGGLGNTFTNTGGGIHTIDLVGVPEPAIPPATPMDVKSNLNGDSGPFGLTRIRQ